MHDNIRKVIRAENNLTRAIQAYAHANIMMEPESLRVLLYEEYLKSYKILGCVLNDVYKNGV